MNIILRCSRLLIASEVSHDVVHSTNRCVLFFQYIILLHITPVNATSFTPCITLRTEFKKTEKKLRIIVWMYRTEFHPNRAVHVERTNRVACTLLIEFSLPLNLCSRQTHNCSANFSKTNSQWIWRKLTVSLDPDARSQKDGCTCSPDGSFFLTTSNTPKTGWNFVEILNAKSDSSFFSVALIFSG
jgi:hypothetical protein